MFKKNTNNSGDEPVSDDTWTQVIKNASARAARSVDESKTPEEKAFWAQQADVLGSWE